MNKNTFLGQLPEEDMNDLVALTADGIAIELVELNGEAKLTIIPNSDAGFATASGDTFTTEWEAQNP